MPEYDDDRWAAAAPIDGGDWGPIRSRSIPLLRQRETAPPAILEPAGASLPLELKSGGQVVFDLGHATQASAILDIDAEEGSSLELVHCPLYRDAGNRCTPTTFTGDSFRNRYIARAGRQTYRTGDTWGARYLLLIVRSGSVRLHGVKAVERLYPFERLGRFDCDDDVLNRIWETFDADSFVARRRASGIATVRDNRRRRRREAVDRKEIDGSFLHGRSVEGHRAVDVGQAVAATATEQNRHRQPQRRASNKVHFHWQPVFYSRLCMFPNPARPRTRRQSQVEPEIVSSPAIELSALQALAAIESDKATAAANTIFFVNMSTALSAARAKNVWKTLAGRNIPAMNKHLGFPLCSSCCSLLLV